MDITWSSLKADLSPLMELPRALNVANPGETCAIDEAISAIRTCLGTGDAHTFAILDSWVRLACYDIGFNDADDLVFDVGQFIAGVHLTHSLLAGEKDYLEKPDLARAISMTLAYRRGYRHTPEWKNDVTKAENLGWLNAARAAKRVAHKGFFLSAGPNGIEIESSVRTAMWEALRARIAIVGGEAIVSACMMHLARFYDQGFDRYVRSKPLSSRPIDRPPSPPIGLLLEFGLRALHFQATVDDRSMQQETLQFATDLYAITELESYSIYAYGARTYDELVNAVNRVSINERIQDREQLPLEFGMDLLHGMLHPFSHVVVDGSGLTIGDMLALLGSCTRNITRTLGPGLLSLEQLESTGLSETKLESATSAFVWKPFEANRTFEIPLESVPNSEEKPFYAHPSGWYYCDSRFITHPAYNALLRAMRNVDDQIDRKLGSVFESHVRHVLSSSGIQHLHGVHATDIIPADAGDCDAVIETDEAIILFQIKKRDFSGEAKFGLGDELANDLAASLLFSQVQVRRSELALREHGALAIRCDDGSVQTIPLRDRNVERVSIVPWSFQPFHFRAMCTSALNLLASLPSTDLPRFAALPPKLQKLVLEYLTQSGRLAHFVPDRQGFPDPFVHFLDYGQFRTILKASNDSNSLERSITMASVADTRSFEWYAERQHLVRPLLRS